MADLHSRLRSTITERLETARAATPGPWTTPGPDTIAQWMVYDADWCVATATAYDHDEPVGRSRGPGYIDPDANAAHIAVHDPASMISLYEGLLRIVDLHRPTANVCDLCSNDQWVATNPCPHLSILADSLGVDTGRYDVSEMPPGMQERIREIGGELDPLLPDGYHLEYDTTPLTGLKPASLTLSGHFDSDDTFAPRKWGSFEWLAPDGCLIGRGTTKPGSTTGERIDANNYGLSFDVTLQYDGRKPNGKHIHTLPWHRRKRFQRIKARWSSFRLRLGSWIAGVDREDW